MYHYCWKGGNDISDSSLFPVYVGTGAATWVSLLPYYCVCVWGIRVGGLGVGGIVFYLATWLLDEGWAPKVS